MKSGKQSPASVNLGNQTYDRGVSDGLHNRPKAIKKSHAHAHRYHAGYRHGIEQRLNVRRQSIPQVRNLTDGVVITTYGEGAAAIKKAGLLTRIMAWLRP